MTSADIIKRIVEADKNAREIYDTTAELRSEFDSYMDERFDELRRTVFEESDRRIAEAEREIIEKENKAIAASDRKLAEDLAVAKAHYIAKREEITEKIFLLSVNVDA